MYWLSGLKEQVTLLSNETLWSFLHLIACMRMSVTKTVVCFFLNSLFNRHLAGIFGKRLIFQ